MAIDYEGSIFKKIGQLVNLYNSSNIQDRTGIKSSVKSLMQRYFIDQMPLETDVECTYQTFDDCFEWLSDQMTTDSETIQENDVTAGSSTFTGTDVSLASLTATQMLLDRDVVRVEYLGSDLWSVSSTKRGQLAERAETDVAFPTEDDLLGYTFTITEGGSASYAVGDYFIIDESEVSDDGVFQTYFRDAHNKVLPSGSSPTIADTLAQNDTGS